MSRWLWADLSMEETTRKRWRRATLAVLCLVLSTCRSGGDQPTIIARTSSASVVLVATPRITGSDDFSQGIRTLTEWMLAAAGLSVIPGSELSRFKSAIIAGSSPTAACERSGVDACIFTELNFELDQARVTLRWVSREGDDASASMQGPNRELSQLLYKAFSALMDSVKNKGLTKQASWNPEQQADVARIVKPQTDALLYFSRGLEKESYNPVEATADYRRALTIDPDFLLPYARLFYTCYESQVYPLYAESDIVTQARFRLDGDTVPWFALAFRDLGLSAMRRGWTFTADTYFRRTITLLSIGKKESTMTGVLAMYGLADLCLRNRNSVGALYYTHAAHRALESMNSQHTFLYLDGEMRLGSAYVIDGKNSLAVFSYGRALEQTTRLRLENGSHQALIRANLALANMRDGKKDAAVREYTEAIAWLGKLGMTNSTLHMVVLSHLGTAHRLAGNVKEAEAAFSQVITQSKILGLDQTVLYGDALYSSGLLATFRGDDARGRYMTAVGLDLMNRFAAQRGPPDFVPLDQLPVKIDADMMAEEARLLSSYCAAYNYALHTRQVQARTYEGRLDDTNVLLKDLLDARKIADPALAGLRERFLRQPNPTGAGVVFVDIGPAIANLAAPGVTAVSLARDFPAMQVIALDLPEQVDIFRQTVAPVLRDRVAAFPNFHVLAGNGVHPLLDQMSDKTRWFKPEKAPAALNGKPLVFRAANSIDIYETWEANRTAFARIAKDFPDSPVLYLFNRSILFKEAGGGGFRVIGIVSPAGFDHMYETFDRKGEQAYTLSPRAFTR